jgi:hypothetical protein
LLPRPNERGKEEYDTDHVEWGAATLCVLAFLPSHHIFIVDDLLKTIFFLSSSCVSILINEERKTALSSSTTYAPRTKKNIWDMQMKKKSLSFNKLISSSEKVTDYYDSGKLLVIEYFPMKKYWSMATS